MRVWCVCRGAERMESGQIDLTAVGKKLFFSHVFVRSRKRLVGVPAGSAGCGTRWPGPER